MAKRLALEISGIACLLLGLSVPFRLFSKMASDADAALSTPRFLSLVAAVRFGTRGAVTALTAVAFWLSSARRMDTAICRKGG